MQAKTALRIALVAEWVFGLATVASSLLLESCLPEPLREYAQSVVDADFGLLEVVLIVLTLVLLGTKFIASICLFLLQRWARWLYGATVPLILVVTLLSGPSVEHALTSTLNELAVIVSGIIVGITFFSDVFDQPAVAPSPVPEEPDAP